MRRVQVNALEAVDYFDSPSEFARASAVFDWEHSPGADWAGGTRDDAVLHCTHGDTSRVAEAEEMIERLTLDIDIPRSAWTPAPCGAYPIIPEYLAGRPDSMRRRIMTDTDTAPIRLYLDLVSSGGIDADVLLRRGVAFLALAMALSRVRPVTLSVVMPMATNSDRGGQIVVIQINAAPLDIATACGALCDGAVTRGLGYAYLHSLGGNGRWYNAGNAHDREGYIRKVRAALDCTPNDIFIPGMYSADPDPMLADPVAFINAALSRIEGV